MQPKRVRHPTDRWFTFRCSPPCLAATQLLQVSGRRRLPGGDLHPSDSAPRRRTRSGPCPRNHPIKRFRSVRRHGRPHRNIRRFWHVRGHGPLLQKNPAFSVCSRAWVAPSSPFPPKWPAPADRGREGRLSSRSPLPPNRTGGFPASGSPVSGFHSGTGGRPRRLQQA